MRVAGADDFLRGFDVFHHHRHVAFEFQLSGHQCLDGIQFRQYDLFPFARTCRT